MGATAVHVPASGAYSSALANAPTVTPLEPPTTNTRPSASRTAAWLRRDVRSAPVGLHRPVSGSKTSQLPSVRLPSCPPAANTRPSSNTT